MRSSAPAAGRRSIAGVLQRIQSVLTDPELTDPYAMRLALYKAIDDSFTGAGLCAEGSLILTRLGKLLEMSHEDLARILRVSGETVRRWERGQVQIPTARMAELRNMAAALDRMDAIFAPGRLAQAIRRPADLFAGETALAWIERGRIAEVADRYEIAFSYQG